MKILLIHHEIPYPIRSGWDKTIYNLIKVLRTSHQVSLIVPVFRDTDPAAIEHIQTICDHLITIPLHDRSKGWLAAYWRYVRNLFLLTIARIPWSVAANWRPEFAQAIAAHCRIHTYEVIQAASDIAYDYLHYARGAGCSVFGPVSDHVQSIGLGISFRQSWRKKLMATLEWRAFRYYETRAYRHSDWVLFYSDCDLQRILARMPAITHARHCPIPTENDVLSRQEVEDSFRQQDPHCILFVGAMGSFTNQDSVLYFYGEIFPKILAQMPQAKFYICGQSPPPQIQRLAQNPQVVVTGAVGADELARLMKKAAVSIAPVRAASGIKTKIYEAMSFGKAIVATPIALEGLWDLGEDVFQVHDDPERFAGEVVNLLKNEPRRVELGIRARDLFERVYSHEAIRYQTLAVYKEIEDKLK